MCVCAALREIGEGKGDAPLLECSSAAFWLSCWWSLAGEPRAHSLLFPPVPLPPSRSNAGVVELSCTTLANAAPAAHAVGVEASAVTIVVAGGAS